MAEERKMNGVLSFWLHLSIFVLRYDFYRVLRALTFLGWLTISEQLVKGGRIHRFEIRNNYNNLFVICSSFALLRSAIMCVRGARSAYHRPQRYDVELASVEARVPPSFS